jgi:hypothetical protein
LQSRRLCCIPQKVLEWLGMVRLWRVGQERPGVLSRLAAAGLAAVLEAPDSDFAIVTP